MRMPNRTILLSSVLLVASAVLWQATGDIPGPTSWQTYGSARFPRILVGALAGLSALLLVRELLQPESGNALREIGAWFSTERRIFFAMTLFAIYILAMPKIGFRWATLAYLTLSLLLLWRPLDRQRLVILSAISVVATLAVQIVFENALAIRLP